jgi:hypothetical protein
MARQYTLPQVLVQQDFALVTPSATQDLFAVIIGPQKKIRSIDDPDSDPYIAYGDYIPDSDTTYSIKGLSSTDQIEPDSVSVVFQNVIAKYATLTGTTQIKVPATNERNKLELGPSIIGGFSEFGSFGRASNFGNRDVKVGDRVRISYSGGVTSTRVIELINDVVDSTASASTPGAGNTGPALDPVVDNPTEYTGTSDTIYEVKVVKGGTWAEGPQVIVTTSNGVDSYGVQTISAADVPFNLGFLGLKAQFVSGTGLTLGNTYYFSVTAKSKGAVRVVRLADSVPPSVDTATALTVDFSIFKNSVTVPGFGYPTFGSEAWELTSENRSILIKSGIQVLDPSWVNNQSEQLPLTVLGAKIFIEYSAIVRENSDRLDSFSTLASVQTLGRIIPENPLAYGVYKALLNSAGRTVYAVAVSSDDVAGYTSALSVTEGEPRAYYMVPLSNDEQIIQLFKSHVISMSDPERAMERQAYVNAPFSSIEKLYDDKGETGQKWSGYVTQGSIIGEYNFVTIPDAQLLSDGIRVGDIFRSNFSIDSFGNEVYESFVIANVVDETHLELATPAFSDAVGSPELPKRVQIVRNLTKEEQASKIAANSSKLGHRRVVNIWPDYAIDGNKNVSGVFVAAAVAGLKSSVAPHQPLTNVTLNGFTDITRSSSFFTPTQLNKIAGGGTWIITKVSSDDTNASVARGSIVTRHQLTTDYSDDNMAEVSITTNLDSIAKWLRDDLRVIIGQYNNHPYLINLIRTRIEYRLTYLQGNARTQKAGPQLISYKVNKVEQDPLIRTKVLADIDLTLPYPVNNINLKLSVV